MELLKRLNAKIINTSFLVFKIFQTLLFSKRKMKILFSPNEEWEQDIKNGFQYTQHEIAFEELSPDNLKHYDLVVPLTMRDLKYLHEVRDLITDNPIPIPSIESILLCDDKYQLNQKLITNGFGDFIPKMGADLTYPYILKKRIDQWGDSCHIIFNSQQEQLFSDSLNNPEYLSQQLIVGAYEYATHILFKDQKIVCSLNVEYYFQTETPIKGKDKPIYRKVCGCPYLEEFSSILTLAGFNGLCCINYKVYDNRPYLLEINPRFGGTLCPYFFSFIYKASRPMKYQCGYAALAR